MTVRRTKKEIEDWLVRELAEALAVGEAEVDPAVSFLEMGIGSRSAVGISGRLQKWLGAKLPATLLFEHPTIDALAAHLSGETAEKGT